MLEWSALQMVFKKNKLQRLANSCVNQGNIIDPHPRLVHPSGLQTLS
jgi:hypothetical protein